MKYEKAREQLPKPVIRMTKGASIGLIGMGSTEPALIEAQDKLSAMGIPTDYMRIRALPFSKEVEDFIQAHDRCYVLELNQDGQLHQILSLDYCAMTSRLVSLAYIDGLPMTADWIIQSVSAKEDQ